MSTVLLFVVAMVLVVAYLIVVARRAGPRRVDEMTLRKGISLRRASRAESGSDAQVWSHLGRRTSARGLDLRFDHDDDPEAQATFLADPEAPRRRNTLANVVEVRLGPEYETHHVHTGGYVFRVRVRGTEPVRDRVVRIQMHVASGGVPYGGGVENDDDTPAAVGGWIEFEELEILQLR